jgi:hypothetical protein
MKKKNKILNIISSIIIFLILIYSFFIKYTQGNEAFGWYMISMIYFIIPIMISLYTITFLILNKKWKILLFLIFLLPLIYFLIEWNPF